MGAKRGLVFWPKVEFPPLLGHLVVLVVVWDGDVWERSFGVDGNLTSQKKQERQKSLPLVVFKGRLLKLGAVLLQGFRVRLWIAVLQIRKEQN